MRVARDRTATATVRNGLDTAQRIHVEGEPFTPDDMGIDDIVDIDEAVDVWRAADRQLRAAKQVKAAAGIQLASLLGTGGAAMIGDTVVRYKLGRTERCHDPDGFTAYCTNEIVERRVKLGDVINPSYAKKSWMDPAVRDTFYEWVDDEAPSLTETPRGKAPKFLQHLQDGDVFVKQPKGNDDE